MTRQTKVLMRRPGTFMPRLTLVAGLVAAASVTAFGSDDSAHAHHQNSTAPAKLVSLVRVATEQFTDVNVAVAAGYGPFLGCVTGPDQGAMGIHYVNPTVVGSNAIDASHPQALIYEPTPDGLRLVGVEFLVDAATWIKQNSTPPVLEGQTFNYVGAPNRFGLPAFFELHVWAWRDNPNGAFVDWNTKVTCEQK